MTSAVEADRALDVELAPYAVVRLAALPYPPYPPATAEFRAVVDQLVAVHAELARIAPAVADALHASAADHSPEFHRKVVLALRRDVHNGRTPRPAVLAALGDLPGRVPGLSAWLDAQDRLARLTGRLARATDEALTAERAVLAELCRAEPLRRAVTMTGRDLLHGVDRIAASGGLPDARARKVEATVLRYALRASAKTSPLSWYTYVAWARWAAPWEPDDGDGGEPRASAQVNRALTTQLTRALLADPGRRERLPHRLAPGIRDTDGRVRFRRDTPVEGVGRALLTREQEVDLAASGPLRFLIAAARDAGPAGVTPAALARALSERLPGPGSEAVAGAYLRQMLDVGLLVAVDVAHPQHLDGGFAVADWLDRWAEPELAGVLRRIGADTADFALLPATERTAALTTLGERWRAVGEAAGTDLTGISPLTEDVALPRPLRLGPGLGRDAAAALPRLAGFAEVFDQALLVRRMLRDRFVERYGDGGRADPAEFAAEMIAAWKETTVVGMDGAVSGDVGPEIRQLATARATLTSAVAIGADGDAVLPEDVVAAAADVLPPWVLARPVSYSFFVQPVGTRLVVNHIYAGFGRFTSRFLDQLGAGPREEARPREEVAAQLRRVFGDGVLAQFRPVNGFNANLHPLMVPHEVGEDAAWVDTAVDALEVRHDPVTDQVRLRLRATGESVDVLYLGFLVPYVLPDRTAPLYGDMACGLVNLSHLTPTGEIAGVTTGGRLRYDDLLLTRRSWKLPPAVVAELRADLADGGDVPAAAVAHWRGRLGLPERVFVSAGNSGLQSLEDFKRYASQPKPQYADLGNALHLRNLSRLLGRLEDGLRLTEALPVPGADNPAGRVAELIIETYRRAR